MRWEPLRTTAEPTEALPLELPSEASTGQGTGRAGLGTPGPEPIAGGTAEPLAVEIRAKSIINRVPAASHMAFSWTINPYRGCSHACVYCMGGDTAILMADGRTKPLAEVRQGDVIYGTKLRGRYRRYVRTEVLAHWSTVKPAFRVELEDGTVLVASGDHRFLSERGWKYVTGTGSGRERRPHLTTNSELLGVGSLGDPPVRGADYRRGYLAGLIRGDGHLGSYSYDRVGRLRDVHHRFRLALADNEALVRAWEYLRGFGTETQEFAFAPAAGARRAMMAIRTSTAAGVRAISELIRWPILPSESWRKGFLAGIFDAEGSCSRGVWRVASTDPEMIEQVASSLKDLGFRTAMDLTRNANGLCYVRLVGGLQERLRFFQQVDPAITRKRDIAGIAIKSNARLGVLSVTALGTDLPMYDITTGTGDFIANGVVSHNCFARRTHTYLDLDAGTDFDTKIMVKVNAGDLLRRELASPRWAGESIAMGTNTDPYQRAEGRYRLMREIISALRDRSNPFSILTKGTLILRDLDLIRDAAERAEVSIAVSVGSVDEALWREVEPGTPAPARRLDVVRRFADAGIGCSVLMAPILPGLSDSPEQIERTVAAIAAAGADGVTPLLLHLRPGAREWYRAWLERRHPRLIPLYDRLYRNGSYAPRTYQRTVTTLVRDAARRHGLDRQPAASFRESGAEPTRAAPVAEQLTLT